MAEAIVAGAVAGAITGAIVALAVGLWMRRRNGGWVARTSRMSPTSRFTSLSTRSELGPGLPPSGAFTGGQGPFDRFNDRAKRVLALAQDEAIRLNHSYIGTEHVLLALVGEGEGVAARVLDSLGVELSKVRTAVEFIVGRGDSTTSPSEITLSPRTKRVIELAIDEARRLGHSHVGTEHLLLGIVREGEGMASGVLESLGVSLERVRHQIIATLGQQAPPMSRPAAAPTSQGQARGPFDRFDSASKRTLAFAQDEAVRFGHNWLGTEHLMLGLLRGEGPARDALVSLGVELGAARAAVEAAVPRVTGATPTEMTVTPRTRSVIDRATGISIERGNAEITPVLLLLSLLEDPDGIAIGVLAQLGAPPDRIRAALEGPPPPPSVSPSS